MVSNMKRSKLLWASALGLMFLVPSCSLDIEETDSLITEGGSAVFNGVESVSGSLDNIYNAIRDQAGDQANLYAMTEVTTDELVVPTRGTDWGDNGVWRTLHAHTWAATHEHVLNVWNHKNQGVLRATEVIHPLSGASAADLAQAKFTRAYNMWIIMDFYGQVPFREATDEASVIPRVMSRSEAYDFIVTDLTDAIAGLPASNPAATNKTRAVKATARFLLAKVKLNANVYKGSYGSTDLDDVISLVDQIEADGYSIVSDYFSIFKGPNYGNADVIWAVDAGAGNRMWNGLHYNQGHKENVGGGWNGFTTIAEFYDKFDGPTGTNALGSGQEERRGFTQTSASTNADNAGFGFGFQFGQMYGWRWKDKDGNLQPDQKKNDAGVPYDAVGQLVVLQDRVGGPLSFTKELPGLIGNNEVTGIRLLKYSPANGAFTSGVVMARFADAHLMRAEAMLRKGNTAGALTEVNQLRAMRTTTPPLASLTEAEMLDERARELYIEGWRRNDMIRFGVFKGTWQFKGDDETGATTDGHTDLFPIPSSALLSNPNLVQNPGY
jgi:starch-binding outer membrane protein, SusD/RagB family